MAMDGEAPGCGEGAGLGDAWGSGGTEGVPELDADGKRRRPWPAAVEDLVIERTLAGETLRGICAAPDMPAFRTVTTWLAERPAFALSMREARAAAGRNFSGAPSTYCQATAEAIFERLCEGESMASVCRDPAMPACSTVYRWVQQEPAFREAVAFARQIQAELYGDQGWELAKEATPQTAFVTKVRLEHLRWYAAKLCHERFGPQKAQLSAADLARVEAAEAARIEVARLEAEAEAAANEPVVEIVQVRDFRMEVDREGRRQRSVEVFHTPGSNVLRREGTAPWMDWNPEADPQPWGLPWDGVE